MGLACHGGTWTLTASQWGGSAGVDGVDVDGPVPALVSVQGGAQRIPQQEDGQISGLHPGDVDWAVLWQSEQFWRYRRLDKSVITLLVPNFLNKVSIDILKITMNGIRYACVSIVGV